MAKLNPLGINGVHEMPKYPTPVEGFIQRHAADGRNRQPSTGQEHGADNPQVRFSNFPPCDSDRDVSLYPGSMFRENWLKNSRMSWRNLESECANHHGGPAQPRPGNGFSVPCPCLTRSSTPASVPAPTPAAPESAMPATPTRKSISPRSSEPWDPADRP